MRKYASVNFPEENGRGDAYFYDGADQLQTAYLDALGVAGAVDANGNSNAVVPSDYRRVGDYRYDAAGNRTYANEQNTYIIGYNPDAINRYVGCGYDALGNMTSVPASATFGGGTWNYGYNAEGQLRTVSGTDGGGVGHSATLYYDALGRCVMRTLDGMGTYLYYDRNWNVIEQRPAGGAQSQYVFVHGPGSDEMIARFGSGPTLWFHQDVKGDVIALTDDGGNVAERYRYDAYGKPYVTDGAGNARAGNKSAFGNRILHKGRDWLGEVGLYDYRARAYAPALGRFLQPDPAGFKVNPNANLYAFCTNDPVNKSDPSGLVIVPPTTNVDQCNTAINYLQSSATFRDMYRTLSESSTTFRVTTTYDSDSTLGNTVSWNPNLAHILDNGLQSPAMGLAHELGHLLAALKGIKPSQEDKYIIKNIESVIAKNLGEPTRKKHSEGEEKFVYDVTAHAIYKTSGPLGGESPSLPPRPGQPFGPGPAVGDFGGFREPTATVTLIHHPDPIMGPDVGADIGTFGGGNLGGFGNPGATGGGGGGGGGFFKWLIDMF